MCKIALNLQRFKNIAHLFKAFSREAIFKGGAIQNELIIKTPIVIIRHKKQSFTYVYK